METIIKQIYEQAKLLNACPRFTGRERTLAVALQKKERGPAGAAWRNRKMLWRQTAARRNRRMLRRQAAAVSAVSAGKWAEILC